MLRPRSLIVSIAVASFLWVNPAPLSMRASAQEDSNKSESVSPVGTLVGHVDLGGHVQSLAPPRVLLMSSDWSELWTATLQQTLDAYLTRYRQVVARDREAYGEIAGWAYREAVSAVTVRMREALADDFSDWFKVADEDGRFEFLDIPLGDYRIVALALIEGRALIWSEAVRVSSPIPQYVEVQNRVP